MTTTNEKIVAHKANIRHLQRSLKAYCPVGDVEPEETYCPADLKQVYEEVTGFVAIPEPPRLVVERDDSDVTENPLDEDCPVKVWCDSRKYRLGNADGHGFSVEVLRYLERELGDQPQWMTLNSEDELEDSDSEDEELEENPLYYYNVDFSDPTETQEFFDSANELLPESIHLSDAFAVLKPVFIYDHSGIRLQTTPFGDPWDSGQIGYAWVSWDDAYEHFDLGPHRRRITKKVGCIKVHYALDGHDVDLHESFSCNEVVCLDRQVDLAVQSLDDWVNGNTWCFEVMEHCELTDSFDTADSCYGYSGYPEDSGCIADGWISYIEHVREWLRKVDDALSKEADRLLDPNTHTPREFVKALMEADNFVDAHHLVDELRSGKVEVST